MDNLNLPPQAIEAEQSTLGAMIIDSRCVDDVLEILTPDNFYRTDHQEIFSAISAMSEKAKEIDVVTVAEHLMVQGSDVDMGYLNSLSRNTPTSSRVVSYAKIVRDRWALRKIIETCNDTIQSAYEPSGLTPDDITNKLAQDTSNITVDRTQGNNLSIRDVLMNTNDMLDKNMNMSGELIGWSTGLRDIDKITSGLQPKLYVIAGRPSMGKTTFSMNMAEAVCNAGGTAQIFTMEMPNEEIGAKILSSQGRVDYGKINRPKELGDDWARITSATGRIAAGDTPWKMFIDDGADITIDHIRSTCRKVKNAHGLDLVLIDYLQLMKLPKADRVDLSVGMVTRQLKNLSKQLNVPVVLLSQLNRSVDARPDKRPVMSDLRESGAIEQDADVIMFVYRDEMYNPDTERKGVAEILIRKNRGGELGVRNVVFRGEFQRFDDFEYQSREN